MKPNAFEKFAIPANPTESPTSSASGPVGIITHPGAENATKRDLAAFSNASTFVRSMATPDWLIDTIIQRRYLYAITAPTSHGKTAISAHLALCVSANIPFAGRRVRQGRVLFLAGENPEDVKGRIAASAQKQGINLEVVAKQLHFREGAAPLITIIDEIRSYAEHVGGIDLVIVDTSAAFFSYQDENDNVAAAQHARDLRTLTTIRGEPCVVVPSHPTKAPDRNNLLPKGGGAFLNELDGNLTIWSDGEVAELGHGKIRGTGFEPMQFEFERIELDDFQDSDGRPVVSVVANPINDGKAALLMQQREQDESRVLYAMLHHENASIADWAQACGWTVTAKSKVHRILNRLKHDKLVRVYRGRWKLTEDGKKEAKHVN
jgi:hypothetical protein